jgi:hypothetical protein
MHVLVLRNLVAFGRGCNRYFVRRRACAGDAVWEQVRAGMIGNPLFLSISLASFAVAVDLLSWRIRGGR